MDRERKSRRSVASCWPQSIRLSVCACVCVSTRRAVHGVACGRAAGYDPPIGTCRLCDERGLMVDPLKLFWVITNSTYLGTSRHVSLNCILLFFSRVTRVCERSRMKSRKKREKGGGRRLLFQTRVHGDLARDFGD